MKYVVTVNGKEFEVEVEKGQAKAAYTGPAAAPVAAAPAVAPTAAAAPAAAPVAAAPAGAGEALPSPMPGTILDVRCSAGQAAKSGDVLFILEAMKMENEICAPRDCTVTSVCVTKGTAVETGTALATLA
ncbi:MAG: acetyl-CoA carboxylase biotin carboxyl carrier protein subunit [Clostridiaceae bacterium]|nr:acetyl-CoA carboxylase biotin carboxyl carrier protein subunit [Clostridiaceae bacterium]